MENNGNKLVENLPIFVVLYFHSIDICLAFGIEKIFCCTIVTTNKNLDVILTLIVYRPRRDGSLSQALRAREINSQKSKGRTRV